MDPHHDALTLAWLVRLRWAALLGTALVATMIGPAMHLVVPTGPLAMLGAAMGISNLAVQLGADRWIHRARPLLGGLLLLDGILLTVALYLTGGAANPFAASYLLLVVLAAATLGRRAGAFAVAAAVVAVATVAVAHRPLVADHEHASHDHASSERASHDPHDHAGHAHVAEGHHHEGAATAADEHLRLHARGAGVVFAVLAALVVYLVSWALRQREVQLDALRAEKIRNERLADVGAFASSAAHELGSPLATIAVVAKELERALEEAGNPSDTVADAQTIRQQVERCREVLDELARVARGEGGEEASTIPLPTLLDEARRMSPDPERISCRLSREAERHALHAPRRALLQVLRSLLANALRASPGSPVELSADTVDATACIVVHDEGEGMDEELLEVAGEQPLSSRQGLGVGLFVGRAILERLGGTMEIDSAPGEGTRVTLRLPLAEPEGTT